MPYGGHQRSGVASAHHEHHADGIEAGVERRATLSEREIECRRRVPSNAEDSHIGHGTDDCVTDPPHLDPPAEGVRACEEATGSGLVDDAHLRRVLRVALLETPSAEQRHADCGEISGGDGTPPRGWSPLALGNFESVRLHLIGPAAAANWLGMHCADGLDPRGCR